MRLAPARSPGCSRVMSDCRASTVTAAPSAFGPGTAAAAISATRIAVVHDPVLRAGQQRRKPAAHRARAAAEVVDDLEAGCRKLSREVFDQVSRTRRRVGGLAQREQLRPTRMTGALVVPPGQDACEHGRLVDHAGSDARRSRAARRKRARSPASSSQARSAAERRRVIGQRRGPGGSRRRCRALPPRRRHRPRPPAGRGPAPRSRPCRTSRRAMPAPADRRRRSGDEIGPAHGSAKGHAVAQARLAHAPTELLHQRRVAVQAAHAVQRHRSGIAASASSGTS